MKTFICPVHGETSPIPLDNGWLRCPGRPHTVTTESDDGQVVDARDHDGRCKFTTTPRGKN